jgi:hypothetical protein
VNSGEISTEEARNTRTYVNEFGRAKSVKWRWKQCEISVKTGEGVNLAPVRQKILIKP